MDYFNCNTGIIITYDQEDVIKIKEKEIRVVPIYKWLLEDTL